jgi:hypothetical protein
MEATELLAGAARAGGAGRAPCPVQAIARPGSEEPTALERYCVLCNYGFNSLPD